MGFSRGTVGAVYLAAKNSRNIMQATKIGQQLIGVDAVDVSCAPSSAGKRERGKFKIA